MHKGQSSNMKHTKQRYKADNTGSEAEHTYIPTLPLARITANAPSVLHFQNAFAIPISLSGSIEFAEAVSDMLNDAKALAIWLCGLLSSLCDFRKSGQSFCQCKKLPQ